MDNINDMVSKGRQARSFGESNGKAKLTEDQVIGIRQDTRTHRVIAQDYGISSVQVGNIKSHKSWGHLKEAA